jgi:hypothetical protein
MTIYTAAVPQPNQQIAATQPTIEANFQYLPVMLGVDHSFTADTATAGDGYHKVIHAQTQGADPALIANTLQMYSKVSGGLEQFFVMDGTGNISNLTENSKNLIGYQWIGGTLLQWGFVIAATSSSTIVVNFPIAFPTNCLVVTGTPFYSGSGPSSSSVASVNIIRTPPSAPTTPNQNLFSCTFTGTSTVTGFYWMAIGY